MNKFEKYEKLGLAERHTNNSSLVLKLVALEIMGEFLGENLFQFGSMFIKLTSLMK